MAFTSLLFSMILASGPALDVRVDGQGLFRFVRDGRAVYTKSAHLIVRDGRLVATSGNDLLPAIDVPGPITGLDVDLQGDVFAIQGGAKAAIGRLVLASFSDEGELLTDNGFLIARDRPTLGNPGDDLFGVVRKAGDVAKPSFVPTAIPLPKTYTTPTPKPLQPVPMPSVAGSAAQQIKPTMPVITVRAQGQSQGDHIMLGDIADVSADDSLKQLLITTPIGNTPAIGVPRGIDSASIIAALERAGFKPGSYVLNTFTGARITRQCQEIDQTQFVAAACEAVQERLGISAPMDCQIAEPAMACPMGEISLKAEQCNKSPMGASVMVAVYVDGMRFNARLIQLSPDKNAFGVKPGDTVKVELRASGAVVQTTAKVRAQAWSGQKVTVETDTGAVLQGTLNANGTVEVEL